VTPCIARLRLFPIISTLSAARSAPVVQNFLAARNTVDEHSSFHHSRHLMLGSHFEALGFLARGKWDR
jgi:hypothetical protein